MWHLRFSYVLCIYLVTDILYFIFESVWKILLKWLIDMKLNVFQPLALFVFWVSFWKLVKHWDWSSHNRKNCLCCTFSATCHATNRSMPWYRGNSTSKTIYNSWFGHFFSFSWTIVLSGALTYFEKGSDQMNCRTGQSIWQVR